MPRPTIRIRAKTIPKEVLEKRALERFKREITGLHKLGYSLTQLSKELGRCYVALENPIQH